MPTVRTSADFLVGHVDPPVSDVAFRHSQGESITPAEAVGFIVLDMWGYPFDSFLNSMLGKPANPVSKAIWQSRDKYEEFLPKSVVNAKYLRELLDAILAFSASWLGQNRGRTKGSDPESRK